MPFMVDAKKKKEPGPAAKGLRALRVRAGRTYRDMAAALGYGDKHSTYSSKELTFKEEFFPPAFIKALERVLVGQGDPEITRAEVYALGGLTTETEMRPAPRKQAGDGRFEFHGAMYGQIAGYSATADAGPGSINADFPQPEVYHLFPLSWIRGLSRAPLDKLAIITVRGDSMTPTLLNGDQVLIDQTVKSVGGDGFYVVSMGDDLVVKRVSKDMRTKTLKIASDNPLAESWDGVLEEDVYILGRVLWLGRAV